MSNPLSNIQYGLFVLTTVWEGRDFGCITNTVIQVTNVPNRISVTLNKSNYTTEMLIKSQRLTVSILSEKAEFDLIKRFGFQSGRDVNKFEGFDDCKRTGNWTMAIKKGTNAYISAEVVKTVDLGTHIMFIADVTEMGILCDVPSTTYNYYQQNIKPKTELRSQNGKTVWRCKICGYEYVGDELPNDFVCPICKHSASDFEKIQ